MVSPLRLESVVGFSGKVKNSLILHPDDTHMIHPLGSTIVIKNVEDPSDQIFLQGHSGRVTCMALSRDGNTLASGQITQNGSIADIILWDLSGLTAETKSEPLLIVRLKLHKGLVQALDFSCDGNYLASIGGVDDNNLVVWNVAKGEAICGSPASHDTSLTVKWMNTSECDLVTGGIKVLRTWKFNGGKVSPVEVQTYKDERTFTCIAVSDDDSTLYCGTTTGQSPTHVKGICPHQGAVHTPHQGAHCVSRAWISPVGAVHSPWLILPPQVTFSPSP